MQIFINGDKWATARINFKDWKPYEISAENFKKLEAYEIAIDPEATTAKTLKFVSAAKMAEKIKAVEVNRKVQDWARKATTFLLDNLFDLTTTQQAQYTLLRDFFDRKNTIPPLDKIQTAQPELYEYLATAVANGDLPPYPITVNE